MTSLIMIIIILDRAKKPETERDNFVPNPSEATNANSSQVQATTAPRINKKKRKPVVGSVAEKEAKRGSAGDNALLCCLNAYAGSRSCSSSVSNTPRDAAINKVPKDK